MTADVSGLEALADYLARAGAEMDRKTRQVLAKGALNIKRDWAANARASSGRYAPHYPRSISYDPPTVGPAGAFVVIGPDKGATQGALGNLLEYGSSKNPPHNDGGRALAAEEPRFLAAIEQLAQGLL
ncbi:hypothetical protein ACIQOW_03700 [Kitasatospora sp. NPDC091335]|uniref:hypothetical protein n=1 Tax=Kitasatospora sp. NPDC091335 TaxID=3364085 RepID=UPI00382CD2DA